MVLNLLLQVSEEAKKQAGEAGDVGPKLSELLNNHAVGLAKRTSQLEDDLEEELKEQKKFITSEDVHEGFESKVKPSLNSASTCLPYPIYTLFSFFFFPSFYQQNG
jgi:cell division cycle protein 37